MAITALRIDGYEHGQLAGPGGYNNLGSASISTTTVRSGARSLRLNPTAAAATARLQNLLTGNRIFAMAFYTQFASFPDNDWSFINPSLGIATPNFLYDTSENKFALGAGSVVGPTLSTGQWYRVVYEEDARADPAVARVVIDNDVAGELTINTAGTPADFGDFFFGQAALTRTFDLFIDDVVFSVTDGDYEQMRDDWTAQAIESIIPSSDGTHNITTSGDFDSFTGTAFSNATTTGNTFIGHRPMQFANTADQVIRQELGTTANYMEFGLENHSLSGDIIVVRSYASHVESAAAGASLGEARLLLADDTEVLTTGSVSVINSTNDPGITVTPQNRMVIAPSGGWDNTKIDGLKARVGFADNAPDVNFIDFMLELLYATPAGQTVDAIVLTVTPTLPTGALTHTITGTVLTVTPSLPTGAVTTPGAGQQVDGVVLTITPTLPVGALAHTITGAVLTVTPSLPTGALAHTITGTVLTVTPSLPTGALKHSITGTVLTVTPSLPAGALTHTITGTVLTVTPELPVGQVTVPGAQTVTGIVLTITPTLPVGALTHTVTGTVLTITPSLPAGALAHTITGVALTVTPSLPVGAITIPALTVTGTELTIIPTLPAGSLTHTVTGTVLTTTPSLPIGTLGHSVTGTVLTVTPSLPIGALQQQQTVTGVVLTVVPVLPIGYVQGPVIGTVLIIVPALPNGQVLKTHGVFLDEQHQRFDQSVGTTVVNRPSMRVGQRFTRRP